MTSHIFLALGMWDDAVAANEASWAASAARVERKRLGPTEHGYHAYLWLSYTYLQQGRIDDARRVVDHMGTLLAQARTRGVAYHYAAARAAGSSTPSDGTTAPPVTDALALGAAGRPRGEPVCRRAGGARRGDVACAERALRGTRDGGAGELDAARRTMG